MLWEVGQNITERGHYQGASKNIQFPLLVVEGEEIFIKRKALVSLLTSHFERRVNKSRHQLSINSALSSSLGIEIGTNSALIRHLSAPRALIQHFPAPWAMIWQ